MKIVHDSRRGQTPGYHGRGDAGSRVGAGPDEIEIAVAGMSVAGAEVTQLCQVVTKAVRGAFHQVVALAPREWSVVDLKLDMLYHIRDSKGR